MWIKADFTDIAALADLFWENISKNPRYISHGEIQMGVADSPEILAGGGKEKWIQYITGKIFRENATLPAVILIYKKAGAIEAFCVLEIEEDGDKPYGVICDMLVREELRGRGMGKQMFGKIMDWFGEQGVADIYLESGINNHPAHEFFDKMGFAVVSHIFRLRR